MADDDIPFNKQLDLAADTVDEPMPGVRRVMANNPGPYDAAHIGALRDAVRGETVTHIFVTHTHRDHSPAVPAIKAATGATVYAAGPHRAARPLHIGAPKPPASAARRYPPLPRSRPCPAPPPATRLVYYLLLPLPAPSFRGLAAAPLPR